MTRWRSGDAGAIANGVPAEYEAVLQPLTQRASPVTGRT
jgi:hypothetical protein